MSWLSPVSWAKWTWTAVRGGEEDEEGQEANEEREQHGERGEEEEEERSQGCRQVLCCSPETSESVIHTVWTGGGGIFTRVHVCVHLSG